MKYTPKEKENRSDRKITIIILLLLLLLTIGVTIWTIWFGGKGPVLAPDYAPQGTEENARPIEGDNGGDKMEQQEGGGAVSLLYSKDITIDLSEKQAKLMFGNPSKSNQNIMIQIVIQDTVVIQSGLLLPGYQVNNLKLFDKVKLSEGKYDGKFVILYYQQDTGEKAMLNTEIPLQITVKQ